MLRRPLEGHRGFKSAVRDFGLRALGGRIGRALLRPTAVGQATVFMLHRFRLAGQDVEGPTVEHLTESLERLRRAGYPILSLEQLFCGLRAPRPEFNGAVVFTIDDGYAEQAEVTENVFARYDCPVTVFLMTGFVDGTDWPWWDQIEYVFRSAGRPELLVELPTGVLRYERAVPEAQRCAVADLVTRLKVLDDGARRSALAALSRAADVPIPAQPPEGYRPMSWDQARRLERGGASLGAHTVSHPILARVDDRQSRAEIEGSWSRLRAELARPVPVFCYPNGKDGDYGPREMAVLAELGFVGAVGTERGYAAWSRVRHDPQAAYAVDRFALPDNPLEIARYASGAERLRQMLPFGARR